MVTHQLLRDLHNQALVVPPPFNPNVALRGLIEILNVLNENHDPLDPNLDYSFLKEIGPLSSPIWAKNPPINEDLVPMIESWGFNQTWELARAAFLFGVEYGHRVAMAHLRDEEVEFEEIME